MHLIELESALRQLRLGGMAAVLKPRLRQAQAEPVAPIDLIACLVSDELTRRSDRLLERRRKQAAFRDPDKSLDNFDFAFNPKMNRSLGVRPGDRCVHRQTQRFFVFRSGRHRQKPLGPSDWPSRHPAGL